MPFDLDFANSTQRHLNFRQALETHLGVQMNKIRGSSGLQRVAPYKTCTRDTQTLVGSLVSRLHYVSHVSLFWAHVAPMSSFSDRALAARASKRTRFVPSQVQTVLRLESQSP